MEAKQRFMSTAEVVALLKERGAPRTAETVRAHAKSGRLPYERDPVSGRLRFLRDDVTAFYRLGGRPARYASLAEARRRAWGR